MSEVAVPDDGQFVVPFTGEVINRDDPAQCAQAMHALKAVREQIVLIEKDLAFAILAESNDLGTKTLHYEGVTATVSGGTSTSYDPEVIEAALRRAGMPEAALKDVVVETVERRVNVTKVRAAAAANPKYARAIAKGTRKAEVPRSVSVKPR